MTGSGKTLKAAYGISWLNRHPSKHGGCIVSPFRKESISPVLGFRVLKRRTGTETILRGAAWNRRTGTFRNTIRANLGRWRNADTNVGFRVIRRG